MTEREAGKRRSGNSVVSAKAKKHALSQVEIFPCEVGGTPRAISVEGKPILRIRHWYINDVDW
jgi:hypothetical protein